MRARIGRATSSGDSDGTSPVLQPLLRAPPFPWAAPASIAVADADAANNDKPMREGGPAVFAALRQARVGGAFWQGEDDPWVEVAAVAVVQANPDEDLAIIAWLSDVSVCDAAGVRIDPARIERACRARLMGFAYRNPFEDRPATLLETIALLASWRRTLDANRGIGVMTGMAPWKRATIGRFLWDGERVPDNRAPDKARSAARLSGRAIAGWASRMPPDFVAEVRAEGGAVHIVEDGFVRSSGLGADGHVPSSITVDTQGFYYDPAQPSDLETLLQTHVFSDALILRAQRLRARICALGIGKYGIDAGVVTALPDRRCVLAVGQVEDDRSVLCGGGGIASNVEFLARVRACEPNAFIVYRPHPDVAAGHRKGHVSASAAAAWVDRIDHDSALLPLVAQVDAVHVLTSLTGFEALLRDRSVTVHGRPFFSGWGLTEDLVSRPDRRHRVLTIDQLVAGVLILYPRYIDPVTGLFCEVETLIDRIAAGQAQSDTVFTLFRQILGRIRHNVTRISAGLG